MIVDTWNSFADCRRNGGDPALCEVAPAPNPRRRGRSRLRIGTLFLTLIVGSASAQVEPTPIPIAFEADLARLAETADSAVLRGEAAIGLALLGDVRHYQTILRIAEDRRSEAKLRGLLALGILAPDGAQVALGNRLLPARHDDPVRHVAAFAIGLIPEGRSVSAIDRYVATTTGASVRRERDTLAALVAGLTRTSHPTRARVVREILENPSIRDLQLKCLAVRMLGRIDDQLTAKDVAPLLASADSSARRCALVLATRLELGLTSSQDRRVSRFARGLDRADSETQALAMEYLTRRRPDLARQRLPRLLRAKDPQRLAVGIRAALRLEDDAARERLANRIVNRDTTLTSAGQAAILRYWRGAASSELIDRCVEIAKNRRFSLDARCSAARIVTRAADRRIIPVLKHLVEMPDSTIHADRLASCYRGLRLLGADKDLTDRIYPTNSRDFAAFSSKLEALFNAQHPSAPATLQRVLADERFDERMQADCIRAWRSTRMPPIPIELDALPTELAALLR